MEKMEGIGNDIKKDILSIRNNLHFCIPISRVDMLLIDITLTAPITMNLSFAIKENIEDGIKLNIK